MIDIHSHIVFGVDDGPSTIEESLALLKEAFSQGVRTIVSTSHRRKNMFETPEDTIMTNFKEVQALAKKELPDLTLLYGAEIYFTQDALDKLESKQIPTLNDTQYALIEFSPTTPYWEIRNAVNKVLLSSVLKPKMFGDKYRLLKKRAQYFLSYNLVHCVASDMHNLSSRPPYMKQAFDAISHQYGKERAEELFLVNPQLIISNKNI